MGEGFLIFVVFAVFGTFAFLAGCTSTFHTQYDNHMSTCIVSNQKYEISLTASRDSSYTNNDVILKAFDNACKGFVKDFKIRNAIYDH